MTQTVALHGLGGVGKTQLAIEYAWKHLGGYEAVLWVRADNPQTLDASLAGIAGVLGLPEASAKEQGVQTDAVLGWLKGRERWLLIADNADTDVRRRGRRGIAWGLTLVAMFWLPHDLAAGLSTSRTCPLRFFYLMVLRVTSRIGSPKKASTPAMKLPPGSLPRNWGSCR